MNSFYTVIEYLKDFLIQDKDVNTCTHGAVEDVDIDKKNIFPLAHVLVTGMNFPVGMVAYNFTIHVLDQRNISKTKSTDKWLKNDNELDNIATCSAVVNRLVSHLKRQHNDLDIELLNEPSAVPVLFQFTNILDGWQVDIQLGISNSMEVC
jgi:hypothetical protein